MVLPDYLKVTSENVPEELKKLNQWVVWKPIQEKVKSKPNKLPLSWKVDTLTGEKKILTASCADPETDSDIYMARDAGARFVFDMWLQFRGYA